MQGFQGLLDINVVVDRVLCMQGLLDINVVVVESVAAVQTSSSATWSSLNVTGCVVQLFFDYAPETAARVLPERMFKPALGALLPETLIAATPSLYGFIGCSCLEGYVSRVGFNAQGRM